MATLRELEARVAAAKERNRASNERREQLVESIKERYDCETFEELKKKASFIERDLEMTANKINKKKADVEQKLEAVEQQLGIS